MTNEQPVTNENNDQPINDLPQIQEDLNETKQKPLLFYVVLVVLILVLIGGSVAGYIFYPFNKKLEGKWVATNQTLQLTSKGRSWELAIPNYQQTKGLTLVYKGIWEPAGVNKYDGKKVELVSKIEKANFSKEEISRLEKKSDLYAIVEETKKELVLQYTKKGIKQVQSTTDLNSVVHISLEDIHWDQQKEKLFLNSNYFSNERIEFTFEK